MPAELQPMPLLLVSEREAARLLGGLCLKTLFNLRRQGLPFVRVGARVMYSPDDLRRWIDTQRTIEAKPKIGLAT